MKKINLFLINCFALLAFSSNSFAQLSVDSTGNVSIPSKLTITSSTNYGLKITRSGSYSSSDNFLYGANAIVTNYGSGYNVGICGTAYSSTGLGSGRSWGVKGHAGNSTSGFNYGVGGSLRGSQYGAGILGTTGSAESPYVPGQFAGYFLGDVKVTGNLTANTLTTSDKRLKKNILSLDQTNTLNNLMLLKPITYNLKQQYLSQDASTDTIAQTGIYEESSQLFQKKHFGLLAQELQEIYPDLVYEDATGFLAVDYTGLIPVLIQSIKELKAEIDSLKDDQLSTTAIRSATANISSTETDETDKGELFQNSPNPFSQSTQIKYFIPSSAQSADLTVYDMQGKQLRKYIVTQRGSGTQTISASELVPGIYLYSLIVDKKEIGVKRMIITD